MIKPIVKNRIKFILGSLALCLISYILGIQLVVPVSLLAIFIYLKFSFKDLNSKKYNLLNLTLLYVIILTLSYLIIKEGSRFGWSVYHIPFSAIIMLSTMLFGQLEISLLLTLASTLTIASLANNSFYLWLLFLVSGILSSILVFDARKRSSIILAGFMIGFIQALMLLFITRFRIELQSAYLVLFFNGLASSIIALGILPIFEYLFKTVTNISLLELADFNQPLLQRLTLEAPGTYHHSIVVGNLSEAACRRVGANALLARIGAYYHDIGKLQKPEYFSENQALEESKHDALAPTMSKMVIMNHVKEGVELIQKYKLNPFLKDFVLQHHGTSLVYYFYRRALENQEEDQEIKEEGFRYPGPKPRTKETAIVLLADSVEAATRTLKDPSPANIEDLVRKVINNKFIDGQLDECDLTLKDLEKISQIFLRILTGIYHSRITYPEKLESSNNNHKKSSKEDSHLSAEDKKSSS